MASFTDTVPQFAPYVPQVDTNLALKIGMDKQQKYEQGIQRIQSNIDNVAGLDIYKDVDKKYLQSKLNSLGNNLKYVAAGDFSDFQLVNSVNGMTNQIVKDKNVINAVNSTAKVKKGFSDMETAKKAGKSSPSNEWIYNKAVGEYAINEEPGQLFGQNYEQAVDTDKPLLEALKAAHADKFEGDENVFNANGTINHDLLNHKINEGLSTSKVASIARSVYSDPSLARQLQIDGLYNYKDYDSNALVADKLNTVNYQKDQIFKQAPGLRTYATLGSGDKQIQANKDLQSNYNTLISLDSDFERYKTLALKNPDAAKTSSYFDSKINQAIKDYSWTTESSKREVDPQFTVNMEKSKFAQSQTEFNEKKVMDQWQIKNIQSEITKRSNESMLAQMKLEGKLDANGIPVWQAGTPAIDSEENAKVGSSSMYKSIDNMSAERNQLFANITSGIGVDYNGKHYTDFYSKNPDTGAWQINSKYLNTDPNKPYLLNDLGSGIYNTAKASMKSKIDATGTLHLEGGADKAYADDIKRWWDSGTVIQGYKQATQNVENQFAPVMSKLQTEAGLKDNYTISVMTPGSKGGDTHNYNLTKQQLTDISLYEQGRHVFSEDSNVSTQAYNRLKTAFGDKADWIISTVKSGKTPMGRAENNSVIDSYNRLGQSLKDVHTQDAIVKREKAFADLQRQKVGQELTFNAKDPAAHEQVRKGLMAEYETIMKDKSNGGYEVAANMLEKMKGDATGLANNIYKFRHDDKTGQWYARIANLAGGTFNENATEVPISQGMVNNLKLDKQLNPKEAIFNNSPIGQMLNLSAGYSTVASTTNDMNSSSAYATALERGNVGNYSIGFHAIAKDQSNINYLPYTYIRDNRTGDIYPHILMDWSKLAALPGLSKDERQALLSQGTVYDKTNLVPAIEEFKNTLKNSKYSDQAMKLLIGNYNKQ